MPNSFIPKKVLEFWQRKGLKSTGSWTDLWHGQHARYFTVAQSVYGDVLNDIYSEIEKAITEGTTLREFKKNLTPILQKKGWWGKAEDGTQLGSPRRLEIMYDTNLRASYAAGYWESIQEHKEDRPYLRYIAVMDDVTRDQHRRFNNIVLPVDDPFWLKYFPPNGWRCRCRVIQMSEEDVKRAGFTVSKSPKIEYRKWVNKKTGAVHNIPEGLAPGFDYNVGVANLRVKARQQVADKMANIAPAIASHTINRIVKSADFKDFYDNPQGYYSIGVLDEPIQQALKSKTHIAFLSDETLLKNKAKHPELKIEDYIKIGDVLGGYDILIQDSDNSVVAIKEVDDKKYWLAIKVTRDKDEIFTQSYRLSKETDVNRLIKKGKRLK